MKFNIVMFRLICYLVCLILPVVASAANPAVPASIAQGENLKPMVWSVNDPAFSADAFLPLFSSSKIGDKVFARMKGRSFADGCTTPRSDLRYLILPHYDGHGHVRIGEMVVNKAIASDVVSVFRDLFRQRYPIERMVLIDEFDGDDERSMAANNTSSFNFRVVEGSKKLSRHATGMAIDINPLYNPFVHTVKGKPVVSPAAGKAYSDRRNRFPYKITVTDPAYKLLVTRGFKWGGHWRSSKDYQHFQK